MYAFSKSAAQLRTSEIRDLMSTVARPGMISFAGGMPNNDLFPVKEIDEIYNNLESKIRKNAFQYGPTSGYPPLLESLREFLRKKGLPVDSNRLLITTGSLQAINIIAKLFIDPDDIVLLENPSFIGGISVFKSYLARMESVPLQNDGIDTGILRKKLNSLPQKPKLLYIIPNFQNPAGVTYSAEKRIELMDIMSKRNIPVLEDDAYNDLYFDEASHKLSKPLKCNETSQVTICYAGTFSKILGPGFRLGWLLVNEEIFRRCELIKQAMDACSPNFTQVLANEFVSSGLIYPYLESLRKEYRERMEIMHHSLQKHMPDHVKWQKPMGGFYFWLELPPKFNSSDILKESIENGAVFVSGKTFDPYDTKNNNIRLSFSNMQKEDIDRGVQIIAETIKKIPQ
jgi:DNA-binding transcriptional MocR family regulator